MFARRISIGPVDLAFTDRIGGVSAAPFDALNLAVGSGDPAVPQNIERVRQAFGPTDRWVHLRQVHGAHVHLADLAQNDADLAQNDADLAQNDADLAQNDADLARYEADGVVTRDAGLTLSVRAADCVPVLLADPDAGVIGAAHAGRKGVAAGVVLETVRAMRARGGMHIQAWIGPYICGACYEVPAEMQQDVVGQVPATASTTSWGTPALDLGAGLRSQLEESGVEVHDLSRCTRESLDLYSYRRDGASAGRHAGIIRIRP
ncbi:MAG: peptidoglycan editing factor PgeF [Marmoricola sp.]